MPPIWAYQNAGKYFSFVSLEEWLHKYYVHAATMIPAAIRLSPNPVWRSYPGGRVLREFRGNRGGDDNHFPEDWLASTVRARNGSNSQGENEGLSWLGDSTQSDLFAESLKQAPEFWYGTAQAARKNPGVLWKLLDASVRLQIQAHPDAAYARRHLNSNAGKTECWYILGTRGDSCVYLGFQHPPTRETWARYIREQRVEEMLACFERIPVKSGDCYVVPAGTPHAIGAGVFMVELMEPTDWVVRCETVTASLALPPEACFMGLGLDACLDVFDYRAHPIAEVRHIYQQPPRRLNDSSTHVEEELIGAAWHNFFRLHRLQGMGDTAWPGNELMLAIIVRGKGELHANRETRSVSAGQTWLLPGCVTSWEWHNTGDYWEILLAKLPTVSGDSGAGSKRVVPH